MKRTAGGLLLLAVLGGCVSDQPDPESINLLMQGSGISTGYPAPLGGRPTSGPVGNQPAMGQPRPAGGMIPGAAPTNSLPLTAAPAPAASLISSVPIEGKLPGSDLSQGSAVASSPLDGTAPILGQQPPRVMMVNSKRLMLNFQVTNEGASGRTPVELWSTHNGQNWARMGGVQQDPPFIVEVEEEGVYGFTLRTHSTSGQGPPPPAPGEPPQVYVEVDLTKPAVRLGSLQADAQGKTLTILWEATDKNFIPQPIALSWARQSEGPWTPIISQLENTGRYVWKLPAGLPAHVWVRIEAADMAGNVATAETPDTIDLAPAGLTAQGGAQPDVSIVAVQPAASESRKLAAAEPSPVPRAQLLPLEPAGK